MVQKWHKAGIIALLILAPTILYGGVTKKDSVERKVISYDLSLRYSVLYPRGTQTFGLLKFENSTDFPPEGKEIEPTGAPALTLGVRFRKYNLYFSSNYVNFNITGETRVDLIFGETDTIPAGAATLTNVQMSLLSLVVTRKIKAWQGGSFGIGAGLILLPYQSEYNIEGLSESYTFQQLYPGPMITFHVDQRLKNFEFQLLAGFLGARINGNTIAYMNNDLSVKYAFLHSDKVRVQGLLAFKYIPFKMEIVNEPISKYALDADFYGPSLGLNVNFLR